MPEDARLPANSPDRNLKQSRVTQLKNWSKT
jgi:hypothetical protein